MQHKPKKKHAHFPTCSEALLLKISYEVETILHDAAISASRLVVVGTEFEKPSPCFREEF